MAISTLRSVQWLRGVAVLSVVLYHLEFFSKGFIGVDLFFAISGFVILNSINNKKLFLRNSNAKKDFLIFLKKRFWRIYPALIVVVTITLLYSIFQVTWLNNSQRDISKYGASSILSVANLFSYKNATNYFEAGNTSKPLLHLWSVSVEIQLYLFFGLVMLLMSGLRINKTSRDLIIIILFVLALTFSEFFANNFYHKLGFNSPGQLGFYSPLNRSWEFFFGCIIFILYSEKRKRNQKIIYNLLVLSCLVYMMVLVDSGILKVTFLGFAIFIHFARYLSFKSIFTPLTHIGDRSYSIYLWHMPVIYFFYHSRNSSVNLIITLFLIYSLSFLTFQFVEQKYRNGFNVANFKKVFIFGSIPTFLILFLYFGYSEKFVSPDLKTINNQSDHLSSGGWELPFGNCYNKNVFDNHCTRNQNYLNNIIAGDSHAGSYVQVVNGDFPNKPFQFKESYIHPGCSMTLPTLSENANCATALSKFLKVLSGEPKLKIYYSEDFQLYGSLYEKQSGNIGCTAYKNCAFEGYVNSDYADKLMENLIKFSKAGNKEIVLIGASPRLVSWPNQYNVWNLAILNKKDVYSEFSSNVATRINDDLIRKVLVLKNQGFNIEFIDPTKLICKEDKSKCKVFSIGMPSLYWDADHLSVSGAQSVFNNNGGLK
jgi:peptidoglycan/LPS O-acetylase OafA/YrhL